MNIYQLFVRTFGNKNKNTVIDGDKVQNGCGTFADINDNALSALKDLGITHIWLTGVLRHSSMTSYPELNIESTNPLITKGKAGSPYSVVDYYDIDPDLASCPENRMDEFLQLLNRIHNHGIKVIIDFIPNHLAREYKSLMKPSDIGDFGENDNVNTAFLKDNNFYYCVNEKFVVPENNNSDIQYDEFPAKASGNNVFSPQPSVNDWYDTVKLNYGVDYQNHRQEFEPVPDTWHKMLHIMKYWCSKGVDGFRVDMAEMVPVEFWYWSVKKLRESYNPVMIAEIYQPQLYRKYLEAGFDYLYDKVGLYNTLENIIRYAQRADTITDVWKNLEGIGSHMLRFMENHDEIRLASEHFVGDALKSLPFVTLAALMDKGPFMIYNGQESGEEAVGKQGFSGDDGRTSIFDYVVMPKHQSWMSGGNFDGSDFTEKQKFLFDFYKKLLNLRLNNKAVSEGAFYDVMWANPWYSDFDPQYVYAFLRYHEEERLLVVLNFNLNESRYCKLKIPRDAVEYMQLNKNEMMQSPDEQLGRVVATDVFTGEQIFYNKNNVDTVGIEMTLEAAGIKILKL